MGTSKLLVNSKFKLSDHDPDETDGFKSKAAAEAVLEKHREKLFELQQLMYGEAKHALLVVLQGMDAAGKDGTIGHIFTGVNPQGCQVTSFKKPTEEEMRHDFLWRVHRAAPPHGILGIFNRSHYEEVLVVRVHGKLGKKELKHRFDAINNFEELLARSGTTILKFFLNISKDEQKARLEERLDHPQKYWKVNPEDLKERGYWDDYMKAYDDALRHCSTKHAPWYVIPSNKKWYRNVIISQILIETLEGLKMKYPEAKTDIKKMKVE